MKRQRGLPIHPGSRSLCIIIAVFTIVVTIAIITQPVHLATTISSFFEGAFVYSQVPRMLLFFLMFILRHGISFVKRTLAQRHATKTATMLRKDLLSNVEKLGQAYISREGTGKTVTLAIEGMQQMETYLHITIPRMFQAVIVPAGIVIYVWFIHHTSAYILVGVMLVVVIFMVLLVLVEQKLAV